MSEVLREMKRRTVTQENGAMAEWRKGMHSDGQAAGRTIGVQVRNLK